jgi:acyl-coenzyme A thioesterase PaaI-like protein
MKNPIASALSQLASPSTLKKLWGGLAAVPGRGRIMGQVIGRMAPYTGTIRPEVLELEPGHARVLMRDRRAVRNHLSSVHAIALMNLGEVATGTAMLVSVPEGARAIITRLAMDYLKKARGPITADCRCDLTETLERKEYAVTADLTNAEGEVVARAHATWLVSAAKA